jgi:urease alpha subunit
MCRNAEVGTVEVDPATSEVRLDGQALSSEPVDQVCLSRLYFL